MGLGVTGASHRDMHRWVWGSLEQATGICTGGSGGHWSKPQGYAQVGLGKGIIASPTKPHTDHDNILRSWPNMCSKQLKGSFILKISVMPSNHGSM